MTNDEKYMALALKEARKGYPSPNPHVGAVIVRRGNVIATGHHAQAGKDHAEVAALKEAGPAARGATMYVTFEPCNHFGRTPPCTNAIIEAGLRRVVVGCHDPVPEKKGSTAKLRRAGIRVDLGILEDEAKELVESFVKHHTTGLPHVTLKGAITLDGRIAARNGASKWITGPLARKQAHALRAESDAVLVGCNTVLVDDPQLTVRGVRGRDPARVLLDTHLRCSPDCAIFRPSQSRARVFVFHGKNASPSALRKLARLSFVTPIAVSSRRFGVRLHEVLQHLGEENIVRVLVEGGARVTGSFIQERLADRLELFVAPMLFADVDAVPFIDGKGFSALSKIQRTRRQAKRLGGAIGLDGMKVLSLEPDLWIRGKLRYPT